LRGALFVGRDASASVEHVPQVVAATNLAAVARAFKQRARLGQVGVSGLIREVHPPRFVAAAQIAGLA